MTENELKEKVKTTETDLQLRAQNALDYVQGLKVENQEDLTVANKVLVRIAQTKKDIIAWFEEPVTTAHKAWKAILRKKNETLAPVEKAKETLSPRVTVYLEAERKKREEAERQAAIKEAAKKREADEAMAKAAKLEEEGKTDEALEALDEATEIEETREKAVIPEAPKVDGIHTRRNWTYRCLNESLVPRDCLSLDSKKINTKIKAGVREIPGLQIYQDVSVSTRTG